MGCFVLYVLVYGLAFSFLFRNKSCSLIGAFLSLIVLSFLQKKGAFVGKKEYFLCVLFSHLDLLLLLYF